MLRLTLRSRLVAAVITALLLAALSLALASAGTSDLDRARAATARFNSLNQATKSGYELPPAPAPLHECIASFVAGEGAMGFHYLNGGLIDATLDPTRPEALVYAPDANGKLRLVALEYVIFKSDWPDAHPPMLFGEMFMEVTVPNRYEIPFPFWALHAWVWEDNPASTFAAFNPAVSCD